MDSENFIYHKQNGQVMSAGYAINSKLLEGGIPALANYKIQKGGSLESLAVPAGLFLLQQSITSKTFLKNFLSKINLKRILHQYSFTNGVNFRAFSKRNEMVNYNRI